MITTSIVFDHRGRVKKGQEGPLEVRVTVNRKPYYINTGVRVLRTEWKFDSVVNRPDCDELNERLGIILRKVEREINACLDSGRAIDVAEIRRNILNVEDAQSSSTEVADWMKERIDMLPLAKGTISHYTSMLNRFNEWGVIRRWNDVTVDAIYRWDAWLHKQTKPQSKAQKLTGKEPEPLGDAGVYNYHKTLKRLLKLAKKAKLIADNPYNDLQGEFSRGEHENVEYLTEEEMEAIINAPVQIGSQLDVVKDMFIVQMFTGMAYADLQKFDITEYKEVDGKWIRAEERVKSGVAFIGHLLPPVVAVLKKYKMRVPMMCNQDYNRALKKLQEKAGVTTSLHSHLARHTFATYMLSNGVKVENLQRMLGHKDIAMTQRYAKTLARSVHNEFDMIAEKMERKKDNQ